MSIIKILKKNYLPLAIFHTVFLVILFANFPFGKYFIGWDALDPEFNFFINFKHAVFASWQENYGVGLVGGHGFASTLPHTILTFLMSFAIPNEAIRPAFTFLCFYLGGLGMYFLSKMTLKEIILEKLKIYPPTDGSRLAEYTALFTAFFYMLNLGTIQMFYVQLEAFIVHFASLPWLFFIAIKVLQEGSKKNLILFFLINFFASAQGFIPTLFITYLTAFNIFLIAYVFQSKDLRKIRLKNSIFLSFFTLAINAYWLFPLIYYQLTHSKIYLDSYNNLMSNRHFIDVNKKYGGLENVALIKGYLFDSYELSGYILKPWISHFSNFFVSIIGYFFFAVTLFGLLFSIVVFKHWKIKAFALIFIIFFIGLSTNFFPFSFIVNLLEHISPTYQQAFRTAFTKFSLGLSFSYSIFLGIGIFTFLNLVKFKLKKSIKFICFLLFTVLLFYSLPVFRGEFLYKNLMLKIPPAYFDVMNFFKDKEDARIADFPQDCPEGWYTYNWGYFGSGFYWYGIKQPILSRTFDVWSNYNENYFWEINQAIHEEQYAKIDSLLQKYNVKWVLFDQNYVYCRSQRNVFASKEFLNYLENSSDYKLVEKFDKGVISPVLIFENKKYDSKSFINIKTNLQDVGPEYKWSDNDLVYQNLGDYLTGDNLASYYPFRAFFTKRNTNEKEFSIENKQDWIAFGANIPKSVKDLTLKIKKYTDLEKNVYVDFFIINKSKDRYALTATLKFPQIFLDGFKIADLNKELDLGEFSAKDIKNIKIFVDGQEVISKKINEGAYQGVFYFNLPNQVEITDQNQASLFSWIGEGDPLYQDVINKDFSVVIPQFEKGDLEVLIPKINDNKIYGISRFTNFDDITPRSCNASVYSDNNKYEISKTNNQPYMRLMSRESSQCLTLKFPDLATSKSYMVEVRDRSIVGRNLSFSILNKSRVVYNNEYVSSNNDFNSSYFIIPPAFKNEIGYDINFENASEDTDKTVNDFAGIGIWEIPYNFIKNIEISPDEVKNIPKSEIMSFDVRHPAETFYSVEVNGQIKNNSTLILSQAFDEGWKAYEVERLEMKDERFPIPYLSTLNSQLSTYFPFFFGREIKDHVLVNNWENGWALGSQISNLKSQNYNSNLKTNESSTMEQLNNKTIVLVFWPQYLEFLGFVLLGATLIVIIGFSFKKRYIR